MARRRRSELFPADRGLQAHMLLAMVVSAVLVSGVVIGLLLLLFGSAGGRAVALWCIAFAGFGWLNAMSYLPLSGSPTEDPNGWSLEVATDHQQRLQAAVDRLCVLADMRAPFCTAYGGFLPQSFTVAKLWRRPTVYVSEGLLRAVDDRELDAVVAHELSHIANRDAVLMTVLTTPTTLLLARVWEMWTQRSTDSTLGVVAVLEAVLFLPALTYLAPVGMALTASSRVVSRHRELYADRCAALLTGSPAGVESALTKIAGAGGAFNLRDLRVVAVREEFHIIPERPQPTGIGRVWATHPPIEARVARLQRMEGELQHARIRAEVSAD